jgi:hypothetical protein
MRRTVLATAATLTLLATAAFVPSQANAMALSTPAGIQAAIDTTSLAQDVAYVCRPVRRCGPGGCWVRRSCFWTGGGGYGWRRGWRHGRRW